MFHLRVLLLAALAVTLQLSGLLALTLPASYEGPMLYHFDAQHAISALDGLGVILLAMGCLVAWGAGAVWQRRMYAS
jgi:hypothetical protein